MTDSEIIDLMYEHATAFSNCVQFSEQGVLDFARAVRDFVPGTVQLGEHSLPYHIRGVTKMVVNPSISTG